MLYDGQLRFNKFGAAVIDPAFADIEFVAINDLTDTGNQRLLDCPHSDTRRARTAALSMFPTKTGASAVSLVIPELKGKFNGLAVRVPTPNGTLVDAVMEVEKGTTVEEVNNTLKATENRYLEYTDLPLVSIDFQGDNHSSIVDGQSTKVIFYTVKAMSW